MELLLVVWTMFSCFSGCSESKQRLGAGIVLDAEKLWQEILLIVGEKSLSISAIDLSSLTH